eukprot:TRINITY_DN6041_c0_g1_i1.p1 TRINITY_DN6041_c0_g1~~TRINITY_DN6041_c0_g1_i1.p1  ORF type:complete len:652 (-),score=52.56 TRINITY_DN6041_c0_g1_i1:17-1972(-)
MCGIAAWIQRLFNGPNGSNSIHASMVDGLDEILAALMTSAAPSRSAPIKFLPNTHDNGILDMENILERWWSEMMIPQGSKSSLHHWIPRRGPDQCNTIQFISSNDNGTSKVRLCGSVLAMRSSDDAHDDTIEDTISNKRSIVQQPHCIESSGSSSSGSSSSSYLCYNGEIYSSQSHSPTPINDTECFHRMLDAVFHTSGRTDAALWSEECALSFEQATRQFELECSFIYARKDAGQIVFGKDQVGRRSLLFGQLQVAASSLSHPHATHIHDMLKNNVFVSSVALPGVELELPEGALVLECIWTELSPRYIYSINLSQGSVSSLSACKISRPQRICRGPPESIPNSHLQSVSHSSVNLMQSCLQLLRQSVSRRTQYRGCIAKESDSLAVLFSGGLDSTVLAALADDCLPPHVTLELINVSFGDSKEDAERGGDRGSARKSFADLQKRSKFPQRSRLILVNVTKTMMNDESDHVRQLTTPLDTVMDLSIAMPLWFAARGVGIDYLTETPSSSTARVILLGGGADEQFGGYSRHRVAFSKGGYDGLEAELHLDMDRIWNRNLGRDDRVVADHGKEGRFPFLDCNLSDWLQTLTITDICNMELPPGAGDKFLLRQVAQYLELHTASKLVKRAVQFGSRLTKMVPKGKGTDKLDPE